MQFHISLTIIYWVAFHSRRKLVNLFRIDLLLNITCKINQIYLLAMADFQNSWYLIMEYLKVLVMKVFDVELLHRYNIYVLFFYKIILLYEYIIHSKYEFINIFSYVIPLFINNKHNINFITQQLHNTN